MWQLNTAYKLLGLQAGEGKTVLLFVAYSLFMGVAVAVFYTCSTSLFLINFDRTQLPLAFIAGGVLVYALGQAVQRLQGRVSFVRLNQILLVFLVVSVSCLLIAPTAWPNKWLYFCLFLWNRVFVFVNGITFWATASRIFNFDQAKRLFSFINLGDVLSSILSYFSVPILLRFVTTAQLLFAALFFLLVCAGMMTFIRKRFYAQLASSAKHHDHTDQEAIAKAPAEHRRYFSLIYLLAFMAVFGLIYVEFMFTVEVRAVYPSPEIMASFLGIFLGICAVIELLIRSFLYTRLISSYSIRIAILILPISLLFSYTLAALYGSFYGTTSLFFAFIALSRFFMSSVRKAISEPAFQLLLQPIPIATRNLLQSRIEGGPKALGNILPGVILLVLNSMPFITLVHLSYVFLAILIGWLAIAYRIQANYQTMLSEAVARLVARASEPVVVALTEAPTTEPGLPFDELVQLTQSDDPDDRVQAAVGLSQSGRYYASRHLLILLQDTNPDVRRAALLGAGRLGKAELWPRLIEHLTLHDYREAAESALVSSGEPAIQPLSRRFNQAGLSVDELTQIVSIINRIGGKSGLRFLRGQLNHPMHAVCDEVIAGLKRLGHRATVTERPHVLLQLDEQIATLVWLAAARLDLSEYPKQSAIIQALRNEKQLVVPSVFNRLSVLYGDTRFNLIGEQIIQKNSAVKDYVFELLNTSLPQEVKGRVLPLFAEVPLAEKLRRCALVYPQQSLAPEARLHDIINKDFNKISPWTKAVALRELLNWHETDPTAILVASAASSHELIAETALYVLKILNPVRFTDLHRILQHQPESIQSQLANRIAGDFAESDLMLNRYTEMAMA